MASVMDMRKRILSSDEIPPLPNAYQKVQYIVQDGQSSMFDTGDGGDIEATMKTAKSAYYAQLSTNYANTNPNRVMTTVTLETASGQQILRESIGAFPEIEAEE